MNELLLDGMDGILIDFCTTDVAMNFVLDTRRRLCVRLKKFVLVRFLILSARFALCGNFFVLLLLFFLLTDFANYLTFHNIIYN